MKVVKPLLGFIIIVITFLVIYLAVYVIYKDYMIFEDSRELITATNLTQIWTQNADLLSRSSGRPFFAIEKECVLLIDRPNTLKCLNLVTGEDKWQNNVDVPYGCNPVFTLKLEPGCIHQSSHSQ